MTTESACAEATAKARSRSSTRPSWQTKPDEPAVDGVVFVPGENVLVLNQSKARGLSESDAGLADTTLNNGGEKGVVSIVKAMRPRKDVLVQTYPHLADATVVYEVFSNRAAPDKEDIDVAEFELQPNERVLVVRGARFAEALGSVFADLRQVESVPDPKRRKADV